MLTAINNEIMICKSCDLYKKCVLHPFHQEGPETADLLVYSNYPTTEESKLNLSWYDIQHQNIKNIIKQQIKFPVKYSYALKCIPNKPKDIKFCMETWVYKEIIESKCKVVLFCGIDLWKNFACKLCGQDSKTPSSYYLNQLFIKNLNEKISCSFAESCNRIMNKGEKANGKFLNLLKKINTIIGTYDEKRIS